MVKRRATGGGIKAAFVRQAERAEAALQTAWPLLEQPDALLRSVPDEYLQEFSAKCDAYVSRRDVIVKNAAKRDRKAPDGADPAGHDAETAKWQSGAAFCVQQLSMWPGSGVSLQLQQQEALLHVIANHDLHLDHQLSAKAYSLMLQHLATHPPVRISQEQPEISQQQPPVLHCSASMGLSWNMFNHTSKPLLVEAASPFPLLQQLVSNAVLLVEGRSRSVSGGGTSHNSGTAPRSSQGSQGQALLFLYVVQLLQADLLVRHLAFEGYMKLADTLQQEAQAAEACSRACTALQHSLLFRVMQDDSVGGDSWRYIHGSDKGKHALVRDLLLLVSSLGEHPAEQTTTRAQAAAAATAVADTKTAAAAHAGEDVQMPDTRPQAAEAADLASGTEHVAPVSAQELIQAARLLLLLLLQLYSSCEEAGVYGSGGANRHHMQRLQGGAGQPNDRFELDDVLLMAIGCGGHVANHSLPHLEDLKRLQRLLLLLPAIHRQRLLSLMIVSVINNRVVDPEGEGKLAQAPYNLEVQSHKEYLTDRGRGYAGFRRPSAQHMMQAVEARLDWAAREMCSGTLRVAFVMGMFISIAAKDCLGGPAADQSAFANAATRVVDHVLLKDQALLASEVEEQGFSPALSALGAAQQQLQLFSAA